MSNKNKENSEEPDEEKKHSPWGNKNYKHAASEIEALRAILEKGKRDEPSEDGTSNDSEKTD